MADGYNEELILLTSGARTASPPDMLVINTTWIGIRLCIDVTAVGVTPSVVFNIQTKDPASGVFTTVLASAAIVGVGHTELVCYPAMANVANVSSGSALGRTLRIQAVHGNGVSITYSLGAVMLAG
jgi:hypothetical protein